LIKARTLLFTVALAGILSTSSLSTRAFAQAPAPQAGQKNWKDRAEYDLYDAISKDTNPKTKLEKLNQWKEKYPTTDFSDLRQTALLTTYAALGQIQEALNTAKESLAKDANDFTSLYYTAFLTPMLATMNVPATPEQLDAAEKAANAILAGAKPAAVSDADWQKAKGAIEAIAHKTLGWVAMTRKQPDAAETEFKKSLAIDPNSGEVPYWLGIVILQERKPEKQSEALYYYARAAAYDGQGALAPAGRAAVNKQLQDLYKKYHGSNDGFDQLLTQAKATPTPPENFKIVSVSDQAKAKAEQEEAEAKSHPDLALWKNIKEALTGANAQSYFDGSMKGAQLPGGANNVQKFTAKVISMEPASKPKSLVVGIENGTTPDATLKFETALPGKVEPGTEIKFAGVAQSYTASPFMVVFDVERKDLQGWTGTNPAPARRPAARKKK
jgi:tetratricopeptide (TPR) repeat protein